MDTRCTVFFLVHTHLNSLFCYCESARFFSSLFSTNIWLFKSVFFTYLPAILLSKLVRAMNGKSRSEASDWHDAWETARGENREKYRKDGVRREEGGRKKM